MSKPNPSDVALMSRIFPEGFAAPKAARVAASPKSLPMQGVDAVATGSNAVTVDFRTAQLIRRAFVPHNPNKMRNAAPEMVDAAKRLISAVNDAETRQSNTKGSQRGQ